MGMNLRRYRKKCKSRKAKDLLKFKKIIQRILPKQSSQVTFTMVLGKKKEMPMKMHKPFLVTKIISEEA